MGGRSKGGGGHTPQEAPDSLRSAQKLRAIGLISLGPIKGPVNKWKDTYFDNTPIQNANGVDDNDAGSFNFKNTEIQYNLGYQDQKPLDGFEASEREVSVGAEVKQQHPITRSVIDPDVTRLRLTIGVNALFSQNDQGDTNGTSVDFQILVNNTPRGTYQIEGKSSSRFYRSYIIDDLPPRPFTVTVKRLTDDSKSQRLQNGTHWVSYTEIIDTKLSYPNMAIVGIKTDSRYNPSFPNINFLLYGRIIKIPTTYNPETRTYAPGLWRGDFKMGWTNNPAWIFYDLITNKLAGLGQRIGDYGIDKFMLYEIAKYCDELVDDGYGGKEPRMVSNLWITEQREAYNVLSDMASVFRAITVWDGTQFTAIQDRPADPVCLYSQSNVKDGKFTRQYAAGKAIFTAVEVEYADERNLYQKAIEYVADNSMIARYGYNVKKMTAYGCTSRGQAHRYGKWVLETSRLEQCTITFTVGRQGLMHLPGDIIEVADNNYAGQVIGGRVIAVNGRQVTLDRAVEITENSHLSYLNADYQLTKIKVISAQGAVITLDTAPDGLNEYDNWVLKSGVVSTQLYRALGITENDDGSYTITALQHEPQKEAIVDGSASFMPSVTTAHGAGVNKPANADVSFGDGGVKLTWTTSTNHGAVKYDVKLYRNGNLYSTHLDLDSPEISFDNLPNGRYTVEIRSKNRAGQLSDPITRTFEINLEIKRFVTKSLLFAIELDWDLPKTATVGNYTEVWRSTTNDISKAVKVATLPYPQNNYVMSGVPLSAEYYFWLRCGDKNDNKGEFTAAVFGEADHNPNNLLNAIEGKITKSHLGQELINSLKNDVDSAVSEEAKARTAAVNNALQQINNQAATTGTAIQKLEKADKDQAETIKTVTAKAESALSGITAVQQAQANSDKANAQQITALTARMGTAESSIANIRTAKADKSEVAGIAQQSLRATWQADAQAKADKAKTDAVAQSKAEIDVVSRAVAGVNSKLLATHTIKTQVVAGGRTAIAGIALGASSDGKTAESSVIVMADKFGIVANANDSNVKQVFSVANGQVGIRGDLVVAGSVTRDKLSSGGGGNLLYNPILANNAHGFFENRGNGNLETGGVTRISRYVSNSVVNDLLPTENVLVTEVYASSSLNKNDRWWSPLIANVKVTKGRRYCFSAHTHAWRCGAQLLVEEMTSSWGFVRTIKSGALIGAQGIGNQSGSFDGKSIDSGTRQHIFFTAPESGHVSLHVRLKFTGYWEASCMIARLMLEECTEHATEPSPWQNAGVTEMHGGSIIANTIRGDHIQANQEIRAPRISGGEIDISGNDGILRVGRTGNFLVRASSQDRGLVMNNDQIIVYDERGNVRVKIGKLM
nr:MAG TPA: tail protein [Caudoviricetes sp.]DAT31946.1 MAG TPA: tail protein [Caudoviricetes sp.]